jgi:hypothetical protein
VFDFILAVTLAKRDETTDVYQDLRIFYILVGIAY